MGRPASEVGSDPNLRPAGCGSASLITEFTLKLQRHFLRSNQVVLHAIGSWRRTRIDEVPPQELPLNDGAGIRPL